MSPRKRIMATIKSRRQSDGEMRYTAIVRIRRAGEVIHRESRTFAHRAAAASWAKHREVELEKPEALRQAQHREVTLAELIRWYIETFEIISKWQRSKQSHLEFLARHAIGKANVFELTPAALIKHIRARRADGAGPATVINDPDPRRKVSAPHIYIGSELSRKGWSEFRVILTRNSHHFWI
jgi:hypothetical protein